MTALAAALMTAGCGSSGDGNDGDDTGGSSMGGVNVLGGVPGTAGKKTTAGSGGAAGGSGGTAGSSDATARTISFEWSTYELEGTTKTPVTCADLGAQTVGFTFSGESLETSYDILSSNGQYCASGSESNWEWEYGSGDFYLSVTLYAGLASDSNPKAIGSGLVKFTVRPEDHQIVVPEVEIVRIMFPLSWSIEKAGVATTCEEAGATSVDFLLAEIRENYSNTIEWTDGCTEAPYRTRTFPGSFDLTATLKGSSGTLASWTTTEKLVFSTESAAIPPPIVFQIP